MSKKVVIPDRHDVEVKETSKADEADGKLKKELEEKKLMRSVVENDQDTIDKGKLLSDAINQGFSTFVPDMMFDNLTKNFSIAKNIYGDKLIRLVTGYSPKYLQKNIKIPEFQKELIQNIQDSIADMKNEKLLKKDGTISEKGISLASLILYTEELDNLEAIGILGEKTSHEKSDYGDRGELKHFRKGDKYKNINVRKSLRLALKRGRKNLSQEELKINEKIKKGSIYLVYAIDSSGSMKGKKIEAAKKAGVGLAFKAIERKDKVGLLVFGSEIEKKINPTQDFMKILREITMIKAFRETNISDTIKEAISMFPKEKATKHIVLISDAVPTIGKDPEKETLEAVSMAKDNEITISIVGIKLDEKGKDIAEKITQISDGRLFVIKNLDNIDKAVLEDYYSC